MYIILLIIIGIAIGYGILMDPFKGAVTAGGILVLWLTVLSPWIIVSVLLGFTPFRALWTAGGISSLELFYSLTFLLLIGCWVARCIVDVVVNGSTKSVKSPIVPPLVLFFAVALFSAFLAIIKGRPFEAWAAHLNLISFYALYFVIVGYLRSSKDLKKIFVTFFIIGMIGVLRGVFYHLIIDPTAMHILGLSVPKIAMASSAGLVIFMMIMSFAILSKDRKAKIFYCLATVFFAIQQVLAFVRSRWIGAIAGITFLFLVLTPEKKARFLKYTLVILIIILIYLHVCSIFPSEKFFFKLPYVVEQRFLSILRPSEEPTALTRFSEWRAVIEKIKEHPIVGNGLGTKVSYIRYDSAGLPIDVSSYIHNSYLFYYLNTGILGLFAILWLSVRFVFYGLSVYKKTKVEYYKAFALGCTTAFVALLVTSFIGAGLFYPSITIIIGFLLGAVALIDKNMKNKP